jgi:hypothetical protein
LKVLNFEGGQEKCQFVFSMAEDTANEITQYAEAILGDLPISEVPCSLYPMLVRHLRQLQSDNLACGDLRRAQHIENTIQTIFAVSNERENDAAAALAHQSASQRADASKQALEDIVSRHEQVVAKFQSNRARAIADLDSQHARDLERFDHSFPEEPPAKFRKFSREYLQLRARESFMVSAKRYDEAVLVRAEANWVEKQERETQQQNWVDSIARQRELLVARQAAQRRCLEERWDKDWTALIASVRHREAQYRNAVLVSEAEELSSQKSTRLRLDKVGNDGISNPAVSIRSRNYTRHNRHLMMNRCKRKS